MTEDLSAHVALLFRVQGAAAQNMGSPFYGELCARLAADAEAGGPVVAALGPNAGGSFEDAYHLRLLAGLHRMALSGEVPALRAHFPSTGGDGDVAATWPIVHDLLRDPPLTLRDTLARPLQTNEVGRAAPLAGGLAVIGRRTGKPLRLLEIGSSAGLNLRLDRYRFEANGAGWGDPASPVRFVDEWDGGAPPFAHAMPVVARRGCDIAPIDATAPGTDLTLLSFVWPGQTERFERLREALAIARAMPVTIDTRSADEWLVERLAVLEPGHATVVFHSIMWQYLPGPVRERVVSELQAAGSRATDDAPLAWLRLEPAPKYLHAELRCTQWPGGDERLLATAGFHAGRVNWSG
jgi:hypothetical protein